MILPELEVNTFVKDFRLQPENWLAAVDELCKLHRLSYSLLHPFREGSNLIAAVDANYVVKIFPAFHRHQWDSEYRVLEQLQGKLSFSVPSLIAYGERGDGWTYVITSFLPGELLDKRWPDFNSQEQEAILFQIGKMMSEVHAQPLGHLISLQPSWPDFFQLQLSTFQQRHKDQGMPAWFVEQSPLYIREALHEFPSHTKSVLLTGEYTPFNMLVQAGSSTPCITGMVDFGDAMTGYREYDLTGPLMFLAAGNAVLVRSLLSGYGYREEEIHVTLRQRLMALQILHRYSDFERQLMIDGWEKKVKNIEALAELICPL